MHVLRFVCLTSAVLPAELQEFLKFEGTDCAHCAAPVFGKRTCYANSFVVRVSCA